MNIEQIVETYLNGNHTVAAEEFTSSSYDIGELYVEFVKWNDLPEQQDIARMLRIVTRELRNKP
jgi:hypothetical protein